MIERQIEKEILQDWYKGRAIIILGPRQVGKTTLIEKVCINQGKYLFFNCDEPITRDLFENVNETELRQRIGDNKVVFIDEAQRVKNIGVTLKLIIDRIKDVQVIVSGSSSFDLSNTINEPLTGRKWEYKLYPISWKEIVDNIGINDARKQLETRLIYGMYPEVINRIGNEKRVLSELGNSYLYKDLFLYQGIRKHSFLENLLKALALQVGSEVNYNELSRLLKIDKNTIMSYIELLEQAFIIFRLNAYSNNERTEIKNSRKIYFYDNGIRNYIISNYNQLSFRNDIGALWENFLISERVKQNAYKQSLGKGYFWRSYQHQEIDYVEVNGEELNGYEFKWNSKKKVKFPKTFTDKYTHSQNEIINQDNFESFIL